MERFSVIHVIATLRIGGAERFCVDLAGALRAAGADATICTLVDGGPFARAAEDLGVPVFLCRRRSRYDPRPVLQTAQRLRRWRPDVVHLHDQPGIMLGGLAAGLAGITHVVATRHDVRRSTWPRSVLVGTLQRRVSAVVASSDSVRRFLLGSRPQETYSVIPCGIDTRRFAYRDPPERARPHLVTVGRLVEQKGHHHLLHAFGRVRQRRPDARLSIIGDGPLRERLQQEARALGVDGFTRFVGPSLDTAPLLDEADLFCFPSLWEPQGLAVLEAQAIGVPVVASAVDGITEMVDDRVTGRLVPPRDPAAMADVILELLSDGAQCRRLARAARAQLDRWDVHRIAARYLELYRDVAARSHRGPVIAS